MSKTHRLKEPSAEEVALSIIKLVKLAAECVNVDHRGDVEPAELVMLTKMYLQRALEELTDKRSAKALLKTVLGEGNKVRGNDTVH